jgi:hypothetical protein
MAEAGRSGGLHIIFSLFLGLMLSTFAGVSVYTFYGPPDRHEDQVRELGRQEEAIRRGSRGDELTVEQRERLEEISTERDALLDAAREERKPWSRNTSIILVVFATLAMAVSLVRADELPVISNGLLLGGLFTMLYGVGWIVATDTSLARFAVITVALGITLGLGYLRFVGRGGVPVAAGPGPEGGPGAIPGSPDIERRLRDLERRMAEAARALGEPGAPPEP